MGDGVEEALVTALEDHPAFEAGDGAFHLTSATLESEVAVVRESLIVTVFIPTLSAVVTDDAVSPIVDDGWFDALERRLGEGYDVTHSQAAAAAEVARGDDEVVVTYALEADDAETAVADAKALIEYAVGTFVQGAIPGYEYGPPLADLLETAFDRGEAPD